MKTYIKWFGLFGMALALSCCKSAGPATPATPTFPIETATKTDVKSEIKEVEKDTAVKTVPDSTFYKAWIECRDGKPVLKQPKSKPGRKMMAPEVNLDENGQLQIKVKSMAEELFVKWKEKHIKETATTTLTEKTTVTVERQFTGWEITQIYLGRIFLVLILGMIVGYLIHRKRKSN